MPEPPADTGEGPPLPTLKDERRAELRSGAVIPERAPLSLH